MLRHTSYVLTNRRIIKARVLSNRVRQWPLEILAKARRIDYSDGLSSYIFDDWEDGPNRPGKSHQGMTPPAIPPALSFWRSFYAGAAVLVSLLLQSQ